MKHKTPEEILELAIEFESYQSDFYNQLIASLLDKAVQREREVSAGRDWLVECYPYSEEVIDEISSAAVIKAIERDYCGGFEQFIKDI